MGKCSLLAVACSLSLPAFAFADAPVSLDVPAGELVAALKTLAKQSDVELLYQPAQLKDIKTSGLKGQYTAQDAVSMLIRGTSLRVYTTERGVMVIAPVGEKTSWNSARISNSSGVSLGKQEESSEDRILLAQANMEQTVSSPTAEKRNDEAANNQPARLEEIVVTAQKRAERLQDVPISISVIGGESLDKSSITSVTDALSLVPGVAVSTNSQGGGTFLAVRGVSPGGPVFAGQSTVGYYIDSVPFNLLGEAIGPDFNAFDLQRIEVLRGPQGSLYGANSVNGLVRVLTNDPDLNQFEVKGRATGSYTDDGGSANYRGDLAINVPLIEGKLGIRAVAGYESLSGWIHNPVEDHTNGADLRNFRLKIAAQPTDALSIGLSVWSSHDRYGAPSVADSDNFFSGPLPQPISTVTDVYAARFGYTFDSFSMSSSTGYLKYYNDDFTDTTPLALPSQLVTNLRAGAFTEELLFASHPGTEWRWSLGGFYRNDVEHEYQNFTTPVFPAAYNVFSGSSSTAVYGEIGHHFLGRKLEWTVGGRYYHDNVSGGQDTPPPTYRAKGTNSHTSPRAVLSWYPDEAATVYAAYSQGFRSGGPQNPGTPGIPAVVPDRLDNYEIGAKGDLLGRKISFDAAIYYMRWEHIQEDILVPLSPGSLASITALINGKSASGVGFDLAITARPLDGLDVGVTGNWNNLSYDSPVYVPPSNSVLFAQGDRLNFSPEYTAGAFADYHVLMGGGYSGTFAASATYTAKEYVHQSFGTIFVVNGTSHFDARTSFAIASPFRWTAMVFVDNLTNSRPTIPSPFTVLPDYAPRVRPRTIGLQIDYRLK